MSIIQYLDNISGVLACSQGPWVQTQICPIMWNEGGVQFGELHG